MSIKVLLQATSFFQMTCDWNVGGKIFSEVSREKNFLHKHFVGDVMREYDI